MKYSLFALGALTLQAAASADGYREYISSLKQSKADEADKISKVSMIAQDLVLHYERAVILGTSSESYINQSLIKHFDEIYAESSSCSEDINLYDCVSDLICQKEISHNLAVELMPCSKN